MRARWARLARARCRNAREAIAGWTAANEQIREWMETGVIRAAIDAGVLP
jgi:hypothetical protein